MRYDDWRKYFPLETPRKEQIDILDKITNYYASGKRFIVLQLGTGGGKSVIAVTLARWLAANFKVKDDFAKGGVIVTSQKTLQDQYSRDFTEIAKDLRSAMNYECLWSKELSCSDALRVGRATNGQWPCKASTGCNKGLACPYKIAKQDFVSSTVGITNYSYLLSESVYAGILKPRQLLILDEAHSIDDTLRKWATVSVDEDLCKELSVKLPKDSSTDEQIYTWINLVYYPALKKATADMLQKLLTQKTNKKGKLSYSQFKYYAKMHDFLDKKFCTVTRFITDKSHSVEYVIVKSTNQDNIRSIEIKPLDISRCANDLLYSQGERCLLMSATILDYESFIETMGIPKEQAVYINIDSPFDPKNYGVIYRPIAPMNKDMISISLPEITNQITQILEDHKTEKGIIHSGSYEITKAISQIKNDRLLIQTTTNRDKILEQHLTSKEPTVLVSPSMTEGLDLKDELGRFQIICKIPFPYLGDPVIKKLLDRSRRWYSWKTALTLVQSVGRCIRSENDWAKTYILDGCFGDFFMKWTSFFTNPFLEMEIDGSHQKVIKNQRTYQ